VTAQCLAIGAKTIQRSDNCHIFRNFRYAESEMRIDPKDSIAGQPALVVRQTLRQLRNQLQWRLEDLECAALLPSGDGRRFLKALMAQGLVESAGQGIWTITQAGQTLFIGNGGQAGYARHCGKGIARVYSPSGAG
jgi:hypothetical protein